MRWFEEEVDWNKLRKLVYYDEMKENDLLGYDIHNKLNHIGGTKWQR